MVYCETSSSLDNLKEVGSNKLPQHHLHQECSRSEATKLRNKSSNEQEKSKEQVKNEAELDETRNDSYSLSIKWIIFAIIFTKLVLQPLFSESHPDTKLNITQLISKHGYPLEHHQNVETEDGYLIDLLRIPYGRNHTTSQQKPVVFLMHGLMGSAVDWFVMGPEKSFPYNLADSGFDVWIGSARGTPGSRKHRFLNPDVNKQYWNFTWHEIGVYDLPASIDYIQNVTGHAKISYIGHSQGTTTFFVMNSERPEYNDKINVMIALAPMAYMKNFFNPIYKVFTVSSKTLEFLVDQMEIYEFPPFAKQIKTILELGSRKGSPYQFLCELIIDFVAGFDGEQLDKERLPIILSNYPSTGSSKQYVHFAQIIETGLFQQYNYGSEENIKKYGQPEPPVYNINKTSTPVALFYGGSDWISSPKDVQKLSKELVNVVYKFNYGTFNHLDYLWSTDVPILTENVIKTLNLYQ